MEFQALIQRALAVRGQFASFEVRNYGREWTTEELTLGLMKDVGDLAALVQASEGVRQAEDIGQAIQHELSDCLWSVIVLADKLGVDLEAAFTQTMDDLYRRLQRPELGLRHVGAATDAAARQPAGTLMLRSDELTPAGLADEVLATARL